MGFHTLGDLMDLQLRHAVAFRSLASADVNAAEVASDQDSSQVFDDPERRFGYVARSEAGNLMLTSSGASALRRIGDLLEPTESRDSREVSRDPLAAEVSELAQLFHVGKRKGLAAAATLAPDESDAMAAVPAVR